MGTTHHPLHWPWTQPRTNISSPSVRRNSLLYTLDISDLHDWNLLSQEKYTVQSEFFMGVCQFIWMYIFNTHIDKTSVITEWYSTYWTMHFTFHAFFCTISRPSIDCAIPIHAWHGSSFYPQVTTFISGAVCRKWSLWARQWCSWFGRGCSEGRF